MSLRRGTARAPSADGVCDALGQVAPPSVHALDIDGGPSLRAVYDAVNALPEVSAARAWATGDVHRVALASRAIGSLTAATYRAACDRMAAAVIPS